MWEALAWWAPEALAGRIAWFILRRPFLMIAGLVLGSRYRSLRDDLTALRQNPGRGDAAARLIERAPDFQKAASIFHDFQLAERSIESARVHAAMVARLRAEGPSDSTLQFLHDADSLAQRREERDDNDGYAYEWDVTGFETNLNTEGRHDKRD